MLARALGRRRSAPRAGRCRRAPRRRAPGRAWRRRRSRRPPDAGVEDALDLDRRDVLAAAPDDVLAPVDEVEVALGVAPDDVAGVEPAVGPGFLGRRLVLQVAEEEVAARVGRRRRGPAARREHRPPTRRPRRRRCEPRRRAARPKQLVPTWRGSRWAMMQAPAPVSVMAQASSSGKPKRSSKAAWWRGSTPAPKPKRRWCWRSRSLGGAASSMAGMTPR